MNLLQIHCSYRTPGGEDVVVANEAALLRAAGHRVVEYRVTNPQSFVAAATNLAMAPWNPFSASAIRKVATEAHPDIAHLHNFWFSLSPSVVVALSKLDVPLVMSIHNYRLVCSNAQLLRNGLPCELCVEGGALHGVRYACYRGSHIQSTAAAATLALHRRLGTWSDRVDLFLCLTTFAARVLARGGIPEERIIVRPNFAPDPGQRASPPSASKDVLYVGRLSSEKGVANLIKAWQMLSPTNLRLLVIGEGPEARLFVAPQAGVRFLGPLSHEHVLQRMKGARALVFPSTAYEGMPMVLVEAMASGLPIIASRLGGLPEILRDGSALALTRPDPNSLLSAFRQLADDAAVDEVGSAARANYLARHTPDQSLQALQDAYETLPEPGRARRTRPK